jgi:hypothetical protein
MLEASGGTPMTDWIEHPDLGPDLCYRREGPTGHFAGRHVVEGITYNAGGPGASPFRIYPTTEGHPVIHVSAEATAPSKRMTLAELAAFVDQARAAGVPDTAGLNVTTKGFGHLRKITTEDGSDT